RAFVEALHGLVEVGHHVDPLAIELGAAERDQGGHPERADQGHEEAQLPAVGLRRDHDGAPGISRRKKCRTRGESLLSRSSRGSPRATTPRARWSSMTQRSAMAKMLGSSCVTTMSVTASRRLMPRM